MLWGNNMSIFLMEMVQEQMVYTFLESNDSNTCNYYGLWWANKKYRIHQSYPSFLPGSDSLLVCTLVLWWIFWKQIPYWWVESNTKPIIRCWEKRLSFLSISVNIPLRRCSENHLFSWTMKFERKCGEYFKKRLLFCKLNWDNLFLNT